MAPMKAVKGLILGIVSAGCVALTGCGGKGKGEGGYTEGAPKFAFVTNVADPFWSHAKAGCKAASKDFQVNVDFEMNSAGDVAGQNKIIENILSKGDYEGIAISCLNPANQTDMINGAAERMPVICHDSDAPNSNRLFYLGTNNVEAGRMLGKLVKERMPEGGKIMIFVGKIDQLNAVQRRDGLLEELNSPPTQGKFIVLDDIQTDNADRSLAKKNAENTLVKYPEINAMIGLWAYNAPQCLEALRDADKLGKVKVFSFDEDPVALKAIKDGHCEGTVVQNPFQFGYLSIKYLKEIVVDKKNPELPANKEISIPARTITKENVEEFEKELKANLAAAEG